MTCVLTLGVRPAGGFRYLNYVAVEKNAILVLKLTNGTNKPTLANPREH